MERIGYLGVIVSLGLIALGIRTVVAGGSWLTPDQSNTGTLYQ